jgi:hypothetical protein
MVKNLLRLGHVLALSFGVHAVLACRLLQEQVVDPGKEKHPMTSVAKVSGISGARAESIPGCRKGQRHGITLGRLLAREPP